MGNDPQMTDCHKRSRFAIFFFAVDVFKCLSALLKYTMAVYVVSIYTVNSNFSCKKWIENRIGIDIELILKNSFKICGR